MENQLMELEELMELRILLRMKINIMKGRRKMGINLYNISDSTYLFPIKIIK